MDMVRRVEAEDGSIYLYYDGRLTPGDWSIKYHPRMWRLRYFLDGTTLRHSDWIRVV